MYTNENFKQISEDEFSFTLPDKRNFKILQLTDLHLGYGEMSKRQDALAYDAVRKLIGKTNPDYIVITGDTIYPKYRKTGMRNNKMQMTEFINWFDSFKIPYSMIFGNHDSDKNSMFSKDEISDVIMNGKYSIFAKGKEDIYGMGNYVVNLTDRENIPMVTLSMLDSNTYTRDFRNFDCVHTNQIDWLTEKLDNIRKQNKSLYSLMFLHMPLPEYYYAYKMMKLGRREVRYNFGSVGEPNDNFGISSCNNQLFDRVQEQGIVKGIFCGHDHKNSISMFYKNIMLTYGMSIDYIGYCTENDFIQRGATLITLDTFYNRFRARPIPLTRVATTAISHNR